MLLLPRTHGFLPPRRNLAAYNRKFYVHLPDAGIEKIESEDCQPGAADRIS
jgi:hypothetical protein